MNRGLLYRIAEPVQPAGFDSKEQYFATVLNDIQHLLTTRYTGLKDRNRNIVNFGIPSIVGYSNDSKPEKDKLARYIKESIEEFEPRLRNISIEFADGKAWQSAACHISASIDINEETERFSFSFNLG